MPAEQKTLLTRDQVDEKYTWDLTDIYPSEEAFEEAGRELTRLVPEFVEKYKGKLSDPELMAQALADYEKIMVIFSRCGSYAHLQISTDRTNQDHLKRASNLSNLTNPLDAEMSFFMSELLEQSPETLAKAKEAAPTYAKFLDDLARYLPHMLSKETEKVMARLGEAISVPYEIYNTAKLADLKFPSFAAAGQDHPLSFVNFEGEYEYEEDHEIRRKAFQVFSQELKKYENTIGTAYASHVRNEKVISEIRGYDSVIDYLLMSQKVDQALYHRQLDVLMEELAPHMRRYARLLARTNGLDKMTYADLKLDLDPAFEPAISVEESRDYLMKSLGILGEDYTAMLTEALDNRWIDFVQNTGKSTGAFCAWPAQVHPYVLISWTERMREVFVLAHELGHAGNSYFSSQKNSFLNNRASTYVIEAPSTMNEMLVADYLKTTDQDPRFQRWVIASQIARTYYHNFVTHFLEGYYQREVYRLVDEGRAVSTQDFSRLFKETLEKFWGDEVELTEGAELTWMRQPHYYMGLYPYTYSAGLTISTQVAKRIREEGQPAVDDWRKVIASGGQLDPVDYAKAAGVDITTDQALKDTVAYIGSLIAELERLTDELEA